MLSFWWETSVKNYLWKAVWNVEAITVENFTVALFELLLYPTLFTQSVCNHWALPSCSRSPESRGTILIKAAWTDGRLKFISWIAPQVRRNTLMWRPVLSQGVPAQCVHRGWAVWIDPRVLGWGAMLGSGCTIREQVSNVWSFSSSLQYCWLLWNARSD